MPELVASQPSECAVPVSALGQNKKDYQDLGLPLPLCAEDDSGFAFLASPYLHRPAPALSEAAVEALVIVPVTTTA